MRHGCEQRGVQPLGPDREAFRVAAANQLWQLRSFLRPAYGFICATHVRESPAVPYWPCSQKANVTGSRSMDR